MKAMLLAAGMGQRMSPLTHRMPKAAVPVLGRPIAVQILLRLARCGVDRVVVNLHRHAELLRRTLENEPRQGLPGVDFTREEQILGTAGGLRNAGTLLRGDGPILVHNSDSIADIDVDAALAAHRRSGCLATLVLTGSRPGYAGVDVDASGRVGLDCGTTGRRPAHGCRLLPVHRMPRHRGGSARPQSLPRGRAISFKTYTAGSPPKAGWATTFTTASGGNSAHPRGTSTAACD